MSDDFHLIWRKQLAALPDIQRNFGAEAALDYIIGEKLFQFAEAAERHPAFARELPNFVAALRHMFCSAIMATVLARIEATLEDKGNDLARSVFLILDENDKNFSIDTPKTLQVRKQRFEHLRDLLVADQLGTA